MFMYPKGKAEEAGPLPTLKLRLGPKVCSPAVAPVRPCRRLSDATPGRD